MTLKVLYHLLMLEVILRTCPPVMISASLSSTCPPGYPLSVCDFRWCGRPEYTIKTAI